MPGLTVHHQHTESKQTHVHWVGDAIQPSHPVVPFSFGPQFFPDSGSFQMSQLFASGGQNIGVSASTSVLPMNTQNWSPLGWTGWISLQSKGLQESSPIPQFKSINSLVLSFLYSPTLTSIHAPTGKTIVLTRWTFVDKVMSLLFNVLSSILVTREAQTYIERTTIAFLCCQVDNTGVLILRVKKVEGDMLQNSSCQRKKWGYRLHFLATSLQV